MDPRCIAVATECRAGSSFGLKAVEALLMEKRTLDDLLGLVHSNQSILRKARVEDQQASIQGVKAPASVAIDENKRFRIGTKVLEE